MKKKSATKAYLVVIDFDGDVVAAKMTLTEKELEAVHARGDVYFALALPIEKSADIGPLSFNDLMDKSQDV